MYVARVMCTDLITVTPKTTLPEAMEELKDNPIDHLLVVSESGELMGIVSDRDLKQCWASPATTLSVHELNYLLEKVTMESIMVKTVITIRKDTTIERAAYIMQSNNINSLPVMENNKPVGIVTSTDVMKVLLQAIGMSDHSVRLSVFVHDTVGSFADVTAVFKEASVNMQSLFCWPTQDYPGIIHMVIRVSTDDSQRAITALNEGGYRVLTGYEKDLSSYIPQ